MMNFALSISTLPHKVRSPAAVPEELDTPRPVRRRGPMLLPAS